jgi:DNA-binding transcriptional LysR family regulator
MNQLMVAFDALPFARWGPLFEVLCIERPEVRLRWRGVGFPTRNRSLLEGADVGLFVGPPREAGLQALTIEVSQMLVLMAVGHRLAAHDQLTAADIFDEPFPGDPNLHPEWQAFWTLDRQRGGPPRLAGDHVENVDQWLRVVAAGRAIATVPATVAIGLPHPGVVAVPLTDGPPVPTRVVWRTGTRNTLVRSLVDIAADMARDPGHEPTERRSAASGPLGSVSPRAAATQPRGRARMRLVAPPRRRS